MAEATHYEPVRLQDYRPPDFKVDHVSLDIELDPEATQVLTTLRVSENRRDEFLLDGDGLDLRWVELDGRRLDAGGYSRTDDSLTLLGAPESFELQIRSSISPRNNPREMGLFERRGILASECEPYGFRRISFFPDRPDILTTYTVRLTAERDPYPVLLSNGNRTASGELDDGRWWVTWDDPIPKPSYIFALFAGRLGRLHDQYVTRSGRRVDLNIYIEEDLVGQCGHAMASLKRALQWDERVYGFEYDLDVYNIVALVGHGNAMENKGLNLFAAEGIVADKNTTLDTDFLVIERIIAHEVFHNWTGNRVTCRDWFQLCLKEGLTRFRDQTYDQSLAMATIKRIWQVKALRRNQFPDDDSPSAHPVRPQSYYTVENFYNSTVYDKGAEIVRMLHNLLGDRLFHQGISLFIARHDMQAATLEDFLAAMAEAGGRNLSQFARWYDISGRPRLAVECDYLPAARQCVVRFRQSGSSGIPEPVVIPVAVGLLDGDGQTLEFRIDPDDASPRTSAVLEVSRWEQSVTLHDVASEPIPSLLRGFSAPVSLKHDLNHRQLSTLVRFDRDPYVSWDSMQRLYIDVVRRLASDRELPADEPLQAVIIDTLRPVLADSHSDKGLAAELLEVPDEPNLGEGQARVDLDGLMSGRRLVMRTIARELNEMLWDVYRDNHRAEAWSLDEDSIGSRMLKNACLRLLSFEADRSGEGQRVIDQCFEQLTGGDCMTDRYAALGCLVDLQCPERDEALDWACEQWRTNPVLLNYWFQVQALARTPDVIQRLQALPGHPAFNPTNTAQAMALYGSFFRQNREFFHDPSGAGYEWLADVLLQVDQVRPAASSWLMPQIRQWRRYDESRRRLMRSALERIAGTEGISRALFENVTGALGEADAANRE